MNLIFTRLKTLFHYSNPITNIPQYITTGLFWDCFNETRFLSIEKMSFTDPRGGLNNFMCPINFGFHKIMQIDFYLLSRWERKNRYLGSLPKGNEQTYQSTDN